MSIIAEVSPLLLTSPLSLRNHIQTLQLCDTHNEVSVLLNGFDLCSQRQKHNLLLVCLLLTHKQWKNLFAFLSGCQPFSEGYLVCGLCMPILCVSIRSCNLLNWLLSLLMLPLSDKVTSKPVIVCVVTKTGNQGFSLVLSYLFLLCAPWTLCLSGYAVSRVGSLVQQEPFYFCKVIFSWMELSTNLTPQTESTA